MARLLAIDTHPVQYKAPLYRRLQEDHGHEVSVLYASDITTRAYRDEEFGVDLAWDQDLTAGYDARFESSAASDRMFDVPCRSLLRTIAAVRPQALMFGGYTGRFVREAMLQTAVLPIPWVFRAETTDHAITRSRLKQRARDTLLQALYRRCSSLAYIGKRSRAHYERLRVPTDKLFFAPYAVETGPFRLEEADREALRGPCRSELGISDDRTVLLFSGKLSPRKDPCRIIDALRELPADVRGRVTVAYLGAGELSDELKTRAARSPEVDIRLLGFKNQGQLSRYYHAADALVLGSLRGETWGLVVNEALHHGVPCLSSDQIGSTPDLIVEGKTGFSFRAGDSASLADAIARLLPMVGDGEVRESARAHVAGYTLDTAARGLAAAVAHATR